MPAKLAADVEPLLATGVQTSYLPGSHTEHLASIGVVSEFLDLYVRNKTAE